MTELLELITVFSSTTVMKYVYVYMIISLCTLLLSAFLAGYTDRTVSRDDVLQCVWWPVYLTVLVGMLVRLCVEMYMNSTPDQIIETRKK